MRCFQRPGCIDRLNRGRCSPCVECVCDGDIQIFTPTYLLCQVHVLFVSTERVGRYKSLVGVLCHAVPCAVFDSFAWSLVMCRVRLLVKGRNRKKREECCSVYIDRGHRIVLGRVAGFFSHAVYCGHDATAIRRSLDVWATYCNFKVGCPIRTNVGIWGKMLSPRVL